MAKLLRSRDRILIGLAVFGDVLAKLMPDRNARLQTLGLGYCTPPGYRKRSLHTAVSRLFKTGLIRKNIKNGEAVWELTGAGKNQLQRSFPLLRWQGKKWDGWWRIVIFDIAVTKNWLRDKLRRKLNELGFGRWQASVYVSPHDVAEDMKEFLASEKLSGQASVLVTRELWPENQDKIERMWRLAELNRQYQTVADYWEKNKAGLDEKKIRWLVSRYLRAVEVDPFLPNEFLPQPWYGGEARQVFHRLHF
jgi:phenylacetic acid degradation operon negative regulatory protein